MSAPPAPRQPLLAHDGLVWRRLAQLGAAHGPRWFVQCSPPLIGLCAALALPAARHAVRDNLRRVRGTVGRAREVIDTAGAFVNYAGCLTEILAAGSRHDAPVELVVSGGEHMYDAVAQRSGVILATAHTGGWELIGPVLEARLGVRLVMAMEPERDPRARILQDAARRATGVEVVHVGGDPFASLALLRRLRDGAAVGLQVDRVPAAMRSVPVRILGSPARLPAGPLRLAQVSGAPIVPAYSARLGPRRYLVEVHPRIHVPRHADAEALERAAQAIADTMTQFVQRHPTQWFAFQPGSAGEET